jgi:hypothetical protein
LSQAHVQPSGDAMIKQCLIACAEQPFGQDGRPFSAKKRAVSGGKTAYSGIRAG